MMPLNDAASVTTVALGLIALMTIVLFTCFLFEPKKKTNNKIAVDMVVLKQSLSPGKRCFLLLQCPCFADYDLKDCIRDTSN